MSPSYQKTETSERTTLTIGVSGASSSGKTTLSTLLGAIFRLEERKDDAKEQSVIVLHQDDYFLGDKSMCPEIEFQSTASDHDFILKSVAVANSAAANGTCPLYQVRTETENLFRVMGPDTDCDDSIRFTALVEDIHAIQAGCEPRHLRIAGSGKARNEHYETEEEATRSKDLQTQYAELIKEMQNKIGLRFQQEYNKICFLDGFLLFNDPTTREGDNSILSKTLEYIAQQKMDRLEEITRTLDEDVCCWGGKELEAERNVEKVQLFVYNRLAKEILQNKFDIKLFLPTSKEAAKRRRFVRPEYIDPPEGSRRPGQMWATEGYFESVVWKNFIDAHKWIDGHNNDVHLRPRTDADIEYTVRWAVDTILDSIAKISDSS